MERTPLPTASVTSQPAPDNPYAVPAGEGGISYRPIYEAVCPHRGRTVFWLGASGCVCVAAAAMSAGALWAIPSAATTLAGAFCPVLIIAALTLGGTAWMLGRHDLRAIGCWSDGSSRNENDATGASAGSCRHRDFGRRHRHLRRQIARAVSNSRESARIQKLQITNSAEQWRLAAEPYPSKLPETVMDYWGIQRAGLVRGWFHVPRSRITDSFPPHVPRSYRDHHEHHEPAQPFANPQVLRANAARRRLVLAAGCCFGPFAGVGCRRGWKPKASQQTAAPAVAQGGQVRAPVAR